MAPQLKKETGKKKMSYECNIFIKFEKYKWSERTNEKFFLPKQEDLQLFKELLTTFLVTQRSSCFWRKIFATDWKFSCYLYQQTNDSD